MAFPWSPLVQVNGALLNTAAAALLLLIFLVFCNLGQAVVEPVVLGFFLIEVTWPLYRFLKRKIAGWFATVITISVTIVSVLALFAIIAWGGSQVAVWLRDNFDSIQTTLVNSTAWLEEHDIFILAMVTDHFNAASLVAFFRTVALRLNTMAAFAALVFLYVVMGLAETEVVQENIARLEDPDLARRLLAAGRGIGEKFRSYLLVRTVASIATGLAIWGFVASMRLDLAGAWGVLAFALNFLPYIGSVLVTLLLPLFALAQADSPATAVYVLLGVSIIQFAIGSVLEPVFSGSALSISPPVVIFSVVLWTFLWGALGAFLGVPVTIAMLTLLEQFPSARWLSDLLAGGPGVSRKNRQLVG
ncbi:AI-2E family transporter [Methylocystis bryophila]|uniref:AI-2E family transporter n=1 Tax=Methylocystis bryophila TaxID=655015 RepID=A0A1W6MW14_9HYPH|nr:AI-2E family transporter [Methylocystis bryophila]ARN81791.1 AI-2E family transporter [Methylocystis bryophila]